MSAVASAAKPKTLHCVNDDWDFDPRYTDGVCPICGWGPGPRPPTQIEALLRKIPWDFVFLVVLAVVLVIIGVLVGRAAGVNLLPSS
jgi:hypothetical protein